MNRDYLIGSLVLSITLLSGCLNTSPLTNAKANRNQTIPMKVTPVPVAAPKPAATVVVDWQKIEAIADQAYQNASTQQSSLLKQDSQPKVSFIEKAYAKSFSVSISEASRRLKLQAVGGTLMEAIQQDLGDAFVEGYYINNDPDEFKVGITTLDTVVAERYVYQFKNTSLTLPIYIYPISDKTKAQILALMEKRMPEIIKRYPETQSIGYSPVNNSINVDIYNKTANEEERKRIEVELTKLVGHPIKVNFLNSPIRIG